MKLNFGKHSGKELKDCPKEYIRWVAEQGIVRGGVDFSAAAWKVLEEDFPAKSVYDVNHPRHVVYTEEERAGMATAKDEEDVAFAEEEEAYISLLMNEAESLVEFCKARNLTLKKVTAEVMLDAGVHPAYIAETYRALEIYCLPATVDRTAINQAPQIAGMRLREKRGR